jgi:protein-L-isoaspartate O-methyltransferase
MERSSQRQFTQESTNWLGRGRAHLLAGILARHLRTTHSPRRLLDVGAGYGQNVGVLARFGAVDAVEVSDFFAERLRKLGSLGAIYQDPIPQLQLSQVYDVVVAGGGGGGPKQEAPPRTPLSGGGVLGGALV